MLSKEEIEKAKMTLKDMDSFSLTDYNALDILLQYIAQLEQENNKLNKINDEMAEWLIGFTFSDKEQSEEIFCDKGQVKKYFEKKVGEK